MGVPPTVSDLEEHLQVQPGAVDGLQTALDAALVWLRHRCIVDGWPDDLREGALIKAHGILVARGAPTGLVDNGEFGVMYAPRHNPNLEDLIGPYRRAGMA